MLYLLCQVDSYKSPSDSTKRLDPRLPALSKEDAEQFAEVDKHARNVIIQLNVYVVTCCMSCLSKVEQPENEL